MNRYSSSNGSRTKLWLAIGLIFGVTFFGGFAPVAAQSAPEEQLAEQYAPHVMLREQVTACDKDGEGYFPASVDFLFNNPDILLKGAEDDGDSSSDPVLLAGFTPQDLVTAGPETYLDFPGNPRDPGCQYEEYFKAKVAELGMEPTTYAKIVVDPVERRLFLQYWFYFYFNDWNNTHETDWEMITLIWDGAASADEALRRPPTRVGFAQHGGGELANWTDPKVEKNGDAALAYSAAGSHATYYGSHTYIGWGERGTGFGCDSTLAPVREEPLNVILVPDVIDPNSDLAFFLYEGKWGERQPAVFNGPDGPNLGSKWNSPSQSISTWRASTLQVPSTSFSSVSATDAFCKLSEWGSMATIRLGTNPWGTLLLVLGILSVVGIWLYKTWPYFAEALDIYGNEIRTFLGIGALSLPIGLIFSLILRFFQNYEPLSWVSDMFNQSTGGAAATAALMGGLQQAAMVLLITPAIIYATTDIRRGVKPGVWHSFRESFQYMPTLFVAIVILMGTFLALGATVLLLPVAIYILVRWQFIGQAAIIDNESPGWNALGQSWGVTRGKWLRTVFLTLGFQLFAILPGPIIGALVLIVGGSRVEFANFISAFVYALVVPIAIIGLTMTYRRLKGEEIIEPDLITRERDGSSRKFLMAIEDEVVAATSGD